MYILINTYSSCDFGVYLQYVICIYIYLYGVLILHCAYTYNIILF